jgi:hypothetical protein
MDKTLDFGTLAQRWRQLLNAQLDVSGATVLDWSQKESTTALHRTCQLITLSSRDALTLMKLHAIMVANGELD